MPAPPRRILHKFSAKPSQEIRAAKLNGYLIAKLKERRVSCSRCRRREERTERNERRGEARAQRAEGNLRGIEDLVHSHPPTRQSRPAESTPLIRFALLGARSFNVIFLHSSRYTHSLSLSLYMYVCVHLCAAVLRSSSSGLCLFRGSLQQLSRMLISVLQHGEAEKLLAIVVASLF